MKRKVKEKFSISKFIRKKPPPTLDEEIERFDKKIHIIHTGKKYADVHDAMDKLSKRGLGRYHRIYGHSVKFLKKNFDCEGEISAGYKHLLGDFVAYILKDVFKIVLKNKNILPPQFFIIKNGRALWNIKEEKAKEMLTKYGKGEWDIKQEAINKMIKEFSGIYINMLKNKTNRKC